ncbi:MAG: ribbon-helix-helix protein, CopG family [Gemmataceae bacterium]|nr:ribbon-helix-helix protein, CopG family [Gemmataceae bacterium]
MKRTTISLDESTLRNLHLLAAERGTSIAAIVREAVEEKIQSKRPRPRSIGIAESTYTDTARLAGEIRPEPRAWR